MLHGIGNDVPFAQNARPHGPIVPVGMRPYLSLGADGKPLQTTILRPYETKQPNEEDWETDDFIEIPELQQQQQQQQLKYNSHYQSSLSSEMHQEKAINTNNLY